MHKVSMGVLCIMIMVIFGATAGMAGNETAAADQDTLCIPMGDLTLAPPETVEARRASVVFPHATHFNYACMTCHHQWDGKEPVQSCGTTGCHDLNVPPEPGNHDDQISYYKNAFHKNCIGCHRKIKAWNKKVAMAVDGSDKQVRPTGPTGCTQCHPQ